MTFLLGMLPAVMLILASCGPKARIVGEVRDGFGNPLSDVEVSIPGTALRAMSYHSGEYSISYVPGKFNVAFNKNNYTSYTANEEVAIETQVPLQPVVLYKRPGEQGVWFFGTTDYVPIKAGKLAISGADRRQFAWVYNMSFQVAGEFTKIQESKSYRFLDTDSAHLVLVRVGSNGILATRVEIFQGRGSTTASMIKDSWQKLAEGVGIREASLGPGRYAYVAVRSDLLGGQHFSEPIFPFEIE